MEIFVSGWSCQNDFVDEMTTTTTTTARVDDEERLKSNRNPTASFM
jgi:hypothetical protein